jgi:hypothetical protein
MLRRASIPSAVTAVAALRLASTKSQSKSQSSSSDRKQWMGPTNPQQHATDSKQGATQKKQEKRTNVHQQKVVASRGTGITIDDVLPMGKSRVRDEERRKDRNFDTAGNDATKRNETQA